MAVTKSRRRCLIIRKKMLMMQLYYMHNFGTGKKVYRTKRWWVHPIWRARDSEGDYGTLMHKMRKYDHDKFSNFTRMSPENFDKLLEFVKDKLKKYPVSREPLEPGLRLALTLRFLATGNSLASISYQFRVGKTTAHKIIRETCAALWEVLQPIYLKKPLRSDFEEVEKGFRNKWNYPNCAGAVDGKHVMIQQPSKSGTLYHNYKGFNSIVLMATVDAHYRFIVVDVGGFGSHSDGGLFKGSAFGQAVQNGTVEFPEPRRLPKTNITTPHVLLGDEAFQLLPNFMRPFSSDDLENSHRIFNYRLSRARRCSENAFGMLATRWRVFRKPIMFKPQNADKIVKACVVLHNYLIEVEKDLEDEDKCYCPVDFADSINKDGSLKEGLWAKNLEENPAFGFRKLEPTASKNFKYEANNVRKTFANYFSSPAGQVTWQWEMKGVKKPDEL